MPYLGYLLAQAIKAGETITSAISSAASYVTKVGGSVVDLSPSAEALKSPSAGSAYINDGIVTSLDAINGKDLTIGCWVYVAEVPYAANRTLWSTNESAGYGIQFLRIDGSATTYRMMFGTGSASTSYVQSTAGAAVGGEWQYVVGVHTTSTNYLYINGNLNNQVATATTVGASSVYRLGCYGGVNTLPLIGNMANWAIWNRALSAEEIRSVMMKSYDDLSATETKGLLSWHPLDALSGNVSEDSHGNYNGTY